jgi:predicted nucleotidyltransferase
VELSYCCVTGSYKRGKPLCSDIDILACLPPSLARADLHTFLREVNVEGGDRRPFAPGCQAAA